MTIAVAEAVWAVRPTNPANHPLEAGYPSIDGSDLCGLFFGQTSGH